MTSLDLFSESYLEENSKPNVHILKISEDRSLQEENCKPSIFIADHEQQELKSHMDQEKTDISTTLDESTWNDTIAELYQASAHNICSEEKPYLKSTDKYQHSDDTSSRYSDLISLNIDDPELPDDNKLVSFCTSNKILDGTKVNILTYSKNFDTSTSLKNSSLDKIKEIRKASLQSLTSLKMVEVEDCVNFHSSVPCDLIFEQQDSDSQIV